MSANLPEAIGLLTDREKQMLRLVPWQPNSSAIARELTQATGRLVTPTTVDKHIKAAMRKLEVGSRSDAARILASAEGVPIVDPPIQDLPPAAIDLAQEPGDQAKHASGNTSKGFAWPFKTAGRTKNDLSLFQRWAWSLALAIAIALLAVGLFTTGGSVLETLARHFRPLDPKTTDRPTRPPG